jgi:hypothetical protein
VLAPHHAIESDIDSPAFPSDFNAVEIASLNPSPEGSAGAVQQLPGLFLVHQSHAFCLDSSHYSSLVLGCKLSHQGTSLFE